MITVVYSTHKDKEYNEKFKAHLLKSVGLKDVQVLEYTNHNQYSLAEVYNSGITDSIYDIVVCCHNDIKLGNSWGKKLLDDFKNNQDFGIIGKAGSCYFPESGVYWEKIQQTMVGQVYHHPEGQKKWLSKYSPKLPFLIPVVTIDGLFIAFDKTKIKHRFDESIGKFHFYDHLFCVPNYLDNIKIGVTSSFDITHESVGQPNREFFESKNAFLEKWGDRLPLDLKPENIYIPEIKEKPIKNIGKVAIVIPTKSNVKMLFDCVNSFYQNCSSDLFDVFIADTGSTDEEKIWIKNNILKLGNVNLIEYDYYNFAKINNDVVKNHIGSEYEFILFSNNDIKIMNNVIYNMLSIMKKNKRVGTIGGRLHFKDNTIQHDGIFVYKDIKKSELVLGHLGFISYFNFKLNSNSVIGNTGGLMMIRKNLFEKLGYFNENYISCLEDVELNLKCKLLGLDNICDSNSVAYHYESQTRNLDTEKEKKFILDYTNILKPFYLKNKHKLDSIIKTIN
jgi:GT2 family glycosyltransferase